MKYILLLIIFSSYFCYGQRSKTFQHIIVNVSNHTDSALVSTPNNYTTSQKYPLLIFLQGIGEAANGSTAGVGLAKLLNTTGSGGPIYPITQGIFPDSIQNPVDKKFYSYIVVAAQDPTWSPSGPDLAVLIPYLQTKYSIDPTRIYLTGLSAGGEGLVDYIGAFNTTIPIGVPAAVICSPAIDINGTELSGSATTIAKNKTHIWCIGDSVHDEEGAAAELLNNAVNKLVAGLSIYTEFSTGHGPWNPFYAPTFTQNGMSIYQWMLQYTSTATTTPPVVVTPPPVVTPPVTTRKPQRFKIAPGVLPNIAPAGDVGINIPSGSLIPGDTVDISNAYAWTYGAIQATGTPANRIFVVNSGIAPATFTGGFTIRGQYLHMTGTGVAGITNGFTFTNPTPNLRSQGPFAMTITDSSKYVEVDHIFIYHVGIGFNVKNENSCTVGLQYPNWVIDSLSIHDNRIIGCWDEAGYLGNTSPDNGATSYDPRPVICNGVTTYPLPLRVGRIHFYNNYIDSSGRGGVQIEATDTSMSEIDHNTILHCGMNGDDAQGTAISTGAYARAYIHDNTCRNTYTWNFAALGFDSLILQNNHFDSAGFLAHYNRANTSDQTFDPSKEPVFQDSLTWVQSGFWKTVPTLFGDSSTALVQNNTWGTCRMMSQQLDLLDQYGLFSKKHPITFCNNTGANGASPINLETPTIPYVTCSGPVVTPPPVNNCPPPTICPTCPPIPAQRTVIKVVTTSIYANGKWTNTTVVTLSDGSTQ